MREVIWCLLYSFQDQQAYKRSSRLDRSLHLRSLRSFGRKTSGTSWSRRPTCMQHRSGPRDQDTAKCHGRPLTIGTSRLGWVCLDITYQYVQYFCNSTVIFPRPLQKHYMLTYILLSYPGLCLSMGITRLPRMSNYWRTNPFFKTQHGTIMGRDRFAAIWKYLHVNERRNPPQVKFSSK